MNTDPNKVGLSIGIIVTLIVVPVMAQTNVPAGANVQTNAPAKPGAQSNEELADITKKLSNPVASLISVPLQNNFDYGGGPNDKGFQYKLNLQPVIPVTLNEDWNLITRMIMPYINQHDRIGTSSQSGLGDTTLSLFLSPKNDKEGEPIWGVGPDFYLPTATETLLGTGKWGAGPTAVVLWQQHGWTYGALANQIWSFAGGEGRQEVNSLFLQPFVAYQTATHTTFTLNSESTYDWANKEWTVPLNAEVSQVVRVGKLPMSFQFGGRYYAEKPEEGPHWGLRFTVTFIFPK
jgi:hypothetical protein